MVLKVANSHLKLVSNGSNGSIPQREFPSAEYSIFNNPVNKRFSQDGLNSMSLFIFGRRAYFCEYYLLYYYKAYHWQVCNLKKTPFTKNKNTTCPKVQNKTSTESK